MGADTFEAREGWVPANTEGSVWCYRTRGNAGVLAFRRTEDGQSLYEATHQDCYASDETITTTRRVEAIRFAVTGAGAADAASPAAASGSLDTPDGAPRPPGDAEVSVAPALGDKAHAMRNAWARYIDATSELLQHVKAHLDDTDGELLGSVDQALALVGDASLKTPGALRDGEPGRGPEPHEALYVTLGAVLRKARSLIAAERPRRLES